MHYRSDQYHPEQEYASNPPYLMAPFYPFSKVVSQTFLVFQLYGGIFNSCYNSGRDTDMQNPVLVINANFEPINVCDLRRAIGLMLENKASLVMNGRGEIHTTTTVYPRPSVIRLQQMVHRPRTRV